MLNPQQIPHYLTSNQTVYFRKGYNTILSELHERTPSTRTPDNKGLFYVSIDSTHTACKEPTLCPVLIGFGFELLGDHSFSKCMVTVAQGDICSVSCEIEIAPIVKTNNMGGAFQLVHGLPTSVGYEASNRPWYLKVKVEFLAKPPKLDQPGRPIVMPPIRNLLAFLDDESVCDCSFMPSDCANPIHASKLLLVSASPFFRTLFGSAGEFAETKAIKDGEPIPMPAWRTSSLVLMLVHVYSGWLPGQPLPKGAMSVAATGEGQDQEQHVGIVTKHACDPGQLHFADWANLQELANMLEMPGLEAATMDLVAKKLIAAKDKLVTKVGQLSVS
ncbi:hypothetical protein BC828DRAFT_382599 [Blastocladiella britannica]|nr:hypothetical protein BC828DRAFT_382599 [Blastocladiella britannica]